MNNSFESKEILVTPRDFYSSVQNLNFLSLTIFSNGLFYLILFLFFHDFTQGYYSNYMKNKSSFPLFPPSPLRST